MNISLEPLDRSSQNLVYRSPVAMSSSSSGGIAIHYILLVLWMMSHFAIVSQMAMREAARWGGV